jgi:hypothetical protein
MDERDDAEILRKKAETDRLFLLYQQEKDKQRSQDAQALSQYHLKQTVSSLHRIDASITKR